MRTREQRRLGLVRALLAGGEADGGELGWDLAGTHVGVVASGSGGEAAIAALASDAGTRALVVGVTEQRAWGWLDAPLPRATPAPDGDARLAVGDPLRGADGFRRTHRQAEAAARVGARRGDSLVAYADVALEALAGADAEQARAFVTREIGALEGEGERERGLRDTLAAWFAAGHNAAAAAAALGVHERTVAYRLWTVEERLGCPPASRRAELETALRLRALL